MDLNPEHARIIAEQFQELQDQFVENVCQVADATIEEMMINKNETTALIRCMIEADDGSSRERFAIIDLADEDFILIKEGEYNEHADGGNYIDITAQIEVLP